MESEFIRIVYMGTPEFAVAPLGRLIGAGYNVVGVITAPDRPAGRGRKITPSAVKRFIRESHPELALLQPVNLKDPGFLKQLETLNPDIQVVVAFRMLPEAVWCIPEMGTFNLHASLLPQYRGAAPINHAIMNGESETGVTTFMIDQQIDTGKILLQEKVRIGERETAGELHDRLMKAGAELVLRTVEGLVNGTLQAIPQDQYMIPEGELKSAPKIKKEDCRIQWTRHGREVVNLVRGLSPYPGAFTILNKGGSEEQLCKIYDVSFHAGTHNDPPGTLHSDGRTFLQVAVPDGTILIGSIQLEGKRKMGTAEFLAGYRPTSGSFRFS